VYGPEGYAHWFNPSSPYSVALNRWHVPEWEGYLGGVFHKSTHATFHNIRQHSVEGGLDLRFDPRLGLNGPGKAIAIQSNGKAIAGGQFTSVNGISRNRIVRFNLDGSVDKGFDPGEGPNASVHDLAADSEGILIGGLFVTVDGFSSRRLARLGFDGRLNRDFKIGSGFNGPVQTIYRRVDGRYLVGGSFTSYDGSPQNNVTLINGDGSRTRNELGMLYLNGPVYSVSENPGGSSIFGGSFTKDKERGYNSFALLDHISSVRPPELGIVLGEAGYQLTVEGAIDRRN
jgi:hypothetical protein